MLLNCRRARIPQRRRAVHPAQPIVPGMGAAQILKNAAQSLNVPKLDAFKVLLASPQAQTVPHHVTPIVSSLA